MSLIPDLPAIAVAPQAAKSVGMDEQNLARQRPGPMNETATSAEQTGPERNRQHKHRAQSECLGQQIRRQQLP